MEFSIVVPAYNAAVTIRQTIESVLAQSSPSWELIVVDDGSSDDTPAVLAAYAAAEPRLRVLRQSNGGEAAARNTGIASASHPWLLFLDADDWIAPRYLETVTTVLRSDPELDAVHCGWVRVAKDGTEVRDDYRAPAGDLFPVLARRAAFPVHACIIRRSLVEKVGAFDPNLRKSPDWDLWQRVARAGAKFGSVPDVLAYYRMTPGSASLDAERMLLDGLTVLRRGHSADPRVPDPRPEYAAGLPGSAVTNQEFYLLAWCAGLMLGGGRDPKPLLNLLGGDSFPGLYPNAIARCLFDAAPLPSCRAPHQWEEFWPAIESLVDGFLHELEAHSRCAGLAACAFTELKKLVLKNSLVWGPVIQQQEDVERELRQTITKYAETSTWLESDREQSRLHLEAVQERLHGFEADYAGLRTGFETEIQRFSHELAEARASRHALEEQTREFAHQNEQLRYELADAQSRAGALQAEAERLLIAAGALAKFEEEPWTRMGFHLRILKRRSLVAGAGVAAGSGGLPGASRPDDAGQIASLWELRVASRNEAYVVYPREDHKMVRVGIIKAPTKARWDIQLNRAKLQANVGERYVLAFRARAERARTIGIGFSKAHAPWSSLGLYRTIRLHAGWEEFTEAFTCTENDWDARIHFDLGGRSIGVELTAIALHLAGAGAERLREPTFSQTDEHLD